MAEPLTVCWTGWLSGTYTGLLKVGWKSELHSFATAGEMRKPLTSLTASLTALLVTAFLVTAS